MLKKLFFAPGRLLLNIFAGGKRKNYRSTRGRPSVGLGVIILSFVCWLLIAGGVLYAVDKAGFLKQALDVGVEVAGVNEPEEPGPGNQTQTESEPEPGGDSPTATGSLTLGDGTAQPPQGGGPGTGGGGGAAQVQDTPAAAEMWLVILHSIPKSARDEADRWQRQYRSKGLEVDVLDTDAFPRLIGGHWIVAIGPFDDKLSATMAANNATKFNAKLLVRRGM